MFKMTEEIHDGSGSKYLLWLQQNNFVNISFDLILSKNNIVTGNFVPIQCCMANGSHKLESTIKIEKNVCG